MTSALPVHTSYGWRLPAFRGLRVSVHTVGTGLAKNDVGFSEALMVSGRCQTTYRG